MNNWLERELERGVREVAAPPELWDRVRSAGVNPPQERGLGKLVWALAATVVLAAVGLSLIHREKVIAANDSQEIAFHCQNPAQLRAWVRANTGLDVPLRNTPPASIQLIGARNVGERVEIAYRAGNRDALLSVSQAGGAADLPHGNLTAQASASSWVMDGQRYTLACNDPAALQLACKLCHLD